MKLPHGLSRSRFHLTDNANDEISELVARLFGGSGCEITCMGGGHNWIYIPDSCWLNETFRVEIAKIIDPVRNDYFAQEAVEEINARIAVMTGLKARDELMVGGSAE